MKQETIVQLKTIIELHKEDSELSSAINYLRMITHDNEPSTDKAVAWIKWYRRITDANLMDAKKELDIRREQC